MLLHQPGDLITCVDHIPCDFLRPACQFLRLGTIAQFSNPFLLGAVNTAKDRVVFFDSVTDDVCATIRASWCEGLNCTFETIECVAAAIHSYLERLVVIVTAGFAFRHNCLLMKGYDAFLSGEEKRGDVSAVQKVAVPTSSAEQRFQRRPLNRGT